MTALPHLASGAADSRVSERVLQPPRLAVCLPRVSVQAYRGGGQLNTLRFADLMAAHTDVRLVSYTEREEGVWFLPDVVDRLVSERFVLMTVWGPHVNGLVRDHYGRLPLVYYQQSMDQGITLPPDVPVISMSRLMMAYAQRTWPASPNFYLPPVLEPDCRNVGSARDIDVLVVRRKQPPYVLDTLARRLGARCRVFVLDEFVSRSELFRYFNRSKVYLYAFAPQRTDHASDGWRYMEGISTQVLEAMACGCTVGCDLRGGHVDFVEPAVHGFRLMTHSPAWDEAEVLEAVNRFPQPGHEAIARELQRHYGEPAFHQRATALLSWLARFLAFAWQCRPDSGSFRVPAPVGRRQRLQDRMIARGSSMRRRWLPGRDR